MDEKVKIQLQEVSRIHFETIKRQASPGEQFFIVQGIKKSMGQFWEIHIRSSDTSLTVGKIILVLAYVFEKEFPMSNKRLRITWMVFAVCLQSLILSLVINWLVFKN